MECFVIFFVNFFNKSLESLDFVQLLISKNIIKGKLKKNARIYKEISRRPIKKELLGKFPNNSRVISKEITDGMYKAISYKSAEESFKIKKKLKKIFEGIGASPKKFRKELHKNFA